MGRRMITGVLAFAMVLVVFPLAASPAAAVSPNIVISQIYGGGGNASATYQNDFVELFNRSSLSVDLTGWSLQYASATGTGNFGSATNLITPLAGVLLPGQYLLVQEASTAAVGAPLPAPFLTDATPISMSGSAGKVALVNTTTGLGCNGGSTPCTAAALTTLVDLVGYGTANYFEGAAAAPVLTNTTSASRSLAGCQDTDDNAGDFTTGTPAPRTTATPLHFCEGDNAPAVVSRLPGAGASGVARNSTVTIGFNEPITLGATWFDITCTASGAHPAAVTSGGANTYALDPASDFANNETCTVTVYAAQVTDLDTNDPPDNMAANDVFSFQTADVFTCGDPATYIHQVQGSGMASPIVGTSVAIEGVVVGDYQGTGQFTGYYLQEESADADADPLTSEGIFVFSSASFRDVQAGDVVRVRGAVTEFAGLTELTSVSAVALCSTGTSLAPTPVSLPVSSVGDLERFEGMLVRFDQTLTATEVFNLGRFGEVSLSGVGRLYTPTAVATPGAAAIAQAATNNRSRIILDDGSILQNIDPTRYPQGGLSASNTLRVGDTLPGLTGVMDYRFSNYRIQPVGAQSFDHTNPRTAAPAPSGGNLKIASFNVLNFFNGDGLGGGFPTARGANTLFEYQRQLAKEVSALRAINADIVGLMEIENDAQPNSALAALVAALNEAMGAGTYAFIDTGIIGTDAIKVALIYKPAVVSPAGAFRTITSATDPRFIDTRNRPSLAQTFRQTATGQKLTVVVNHLKSKGSACAGDPDTGDGQGNCNLTRTAAAEALVDWLATDPTGSGDPDFLLIGDLNSYTFEDPITALVAGGFTNMVRAFGGLSAYSYVFNGESGYLDHALATASLAAKVVSVTDWHINPDEPTVLDYNVEFKTTNQITTFYDAGPYRSSDHDPVVVGLDLSDTTRPTIISTQLPSPNGNGWNNTSVSVTFTCADDVAIATCVGDTTLTAETSGQTVTGTATDVSGNTATASVIVRIDKTAPTFTWTGTRTYRVDETVNLTCAITETLSGLDPAIPSHCDSANGPAVAFGLGTHTLTASATDRAGNAATAAISFTVGVDSSSLCSLIQLYVSKQGVAKSLCGKIEKAAKRLAAGRDKNFENELKAFTNEVNAQRGKSISDANATLLIMLAENL